MQITLVKLKLYVTEKCQKTKNSVAGEPGLVDRVHA